MLTSPDENWEPVGRVVLRWLANPYPHEPIIAAVPVTGEPNPANTAVLLAVVALALALAALATAIRTQHRAI
jgi:hypothetical protein